MGVPRFDLMLSVEDFIKWNENNISSTNPSKHYFDFESGLGGGINLHLERPPKGKVPTRLEQFFLSIVGKPTLNLDFVSLFVATWAHRKLLTLSVMLKLYTYQYRRGWKGKIPTSSLTFYFSTAFAEPVILNICHEKNYIINNIRFILLTTSIIYLQKLVNWSHNNSNIYVWWLKKRHVLAWN